MFVNLLQVLLSSLPWHETFYRLLNFAAELTHSSDSGELWRFLEQCHQSQPPDPGTPLHINWTSVASSGEAQSRDFTCQTPQQDCLPSIPDNVRYFNQFIIH